ncbi:MAG: helix-turn-helix domain-containing protein [Phycisphaerae bacterium]
MATALKPNPSALLTSSQAAEVIGVTEGTLETWRCTKRYQIPYLKIGRNVRYRRAALEAWLESRTVSA